jgi:Leucine-rich repeat (LRR) protein
LEEIGDLAPLAGLSELKTVIAKGEQVADLGPLAGLSFLQFLDVSGTRVSDLAPLAGLSALQTLDVSGTRVSDLAPLAGLSALQTLYVSSRLVTDLAPLAGLSVLQTLNVSGTQITDLAPLAGLSALQSLYVSHTQVRDLSPLASLSALQSLDVSGTRVTNLAPLAGLSAMQTLDVSGTQVTDLAPVAGLSALQTLNVSDSQVTVLAPLADLPALQTLNVSRTQVTDLAPLGGLSALQTLDVFGTQVTDLAPLAGLSALQTLNVSRTAVTGLAPLAGLSALQTLDVSRTQVTDLSPLAALIARGCPVQWSSKSWRGKGIYVEDCPLQNPPPTIASQGNTAILNYFRERALGDVDHLYEAKMLILGEGRSGKTSLLRRLYQPGLPLPAEKETTKGIAIYRHEFEMKNGRSFRLNVWDFGGQEIYHATHQFFLTHRSLYLLVDDTSKDHKSVSDEGFKYWLELIDVFGGHSPVLIFQNEKGGCTKQIDIAGVKGRYDNVKELYGANLEHSGAAGQVRQGIEFFAANLSHIGEELPSRWIDVRAEIEKCAGEVPYIPQEEYFQIYGRYLEFDRTRALHLSRYLHDLGVFLHFQDDPLLARTVILQNQWATEAVFRILDDEIVKAKRGRFDGTDCERLWRDSAYADMRPELLALMQRFELCYELRDSKPPTWLAPQLLPPAKPAGLHGWGGPGDLVLRYSYAFLPKGTISRLTVRLHRFVRDPEMAWITGVLFERDSSGVLVEVLPNGSEIELRARGRERKALLSVVAADLDALNDGFQGLRDRVEKRIPCNCTRCRTAAVPEFFGEQNLLRRKEHNRLKVECPTSFEDVDVLELLEGIRVDKLPVWAHAEPAASVLRPIRIFLASSAELRDDRDEFDLYFRQQNDQLRKRGVYVEIVRWEKFLDAMSETRLQDEYNKEIRACDIFVCLFFTKTGKFTEEEFDVAHRQFQETKRPRIFTFFKNADIKTGSARKEDLNSLWAFQDKLKKLGHFHTQYENTDDLKLQFQNQLDRLLERRGVASNLLN